MAAPFILFAGILAFWCLAALGGSWSFAVIAGLGAIAAALIVWTGQRLRIADGEGAAPFANLVVTTGLILARTPSRTIDAVRVLAAALGAGSKAPVFVRLKLRPATPLGAASVIAAMSATPGTVVVDADVGSLLAHVLSETDVDVAAMQRLERAALAVAGGAAR